MPTLRWLTRDTDIHAAARVPYACWKKPLTRLPAIRMRATS